VHPTATASVAIIRRETVSNLEGLAPIGLGRPAKRRESGMDQGRDGFTGFVLPPGLRRSHGRAVER
jgi:hypothetical protein